MKKLTKEEQKAEAWEAYKATRAEALQAYYAECEEIDEQKEDKLVKTIEVWGCGMCGKSGGNRKFMEDHQCSKTKKAEALKVYEAIDKQRVEACRANDCSAWETCEAKKASALNNFIAKCNEIDKESK